MLNMMKAGLALVAIIGMVSGQDSFKESPEEVFQASFLPMFDGNGLVVADDFSAVYATSADGSVIALDPKDGSTQWQYQPAGDGSTPFSGNGEVSIAVDGSYIAYAVSVGDQCQVVALNPDGSTVWESPTLPGKCNGTPNISSDGKNVFVVHNEVDDSAGHFSVLDAEASGQAVYTYSNSTGPFSQPGFYRNPIKGNYPAGASNNADISVWSLRPSQTATGGEDGAVFAFQMPPASAVAGPEAVVLNPAVTWRSTAPPMITNSGQDLYYAVSRSRVNAWNQGNAFNRGANGKASFDRGVPSFKAAPHTMAGNSDTLPTIVCGGSAAQEFPCLDANNIANDAALWNAVISPGIVVADPKFSTNYDRVHFADNVGVIRSANPATGDLLMNAPTGVQIEANFGLSPDGAYMYFGDTSGTIVAWQLADSTLEGPGPAVPPDTPPEDVAGEPTATPTEEETTQPSITARPTMSPAPSPEPSMSPAPSAMTEVTPPPADEGGLPSPTAPSPTSPAGSSAASVKAILSALVASSFAFMLL